MSAIKTYEEGDVKLSFYSYRSLHSDIIVEALTTAIPEAETYQNEIIVASWKWFLVTISCLTSIEATSKDLSEDEALLMDFWQKAQSDFSAGNWRDVWNAYSLLSYDMQFLITKGYNATRRESLGLTDKDIGGDDNKDPK